MRKIIVILALFAVACTHYPSNRYVELRTSWKDAYPEVQFYIESKHLPRTRHDFAYLSRIGGYRVANIPPGEYYLYAYFEVGRFTLELGTVRMKNDDLEIRIDKSADFGSLVRNRHSPLD